MDEIAHETAILAAFVHILMTVALGFSVQSG